MNPHSSPLPADPGAVAWRAWICRVLLAVLPVTLALGYYYRPALRGGVELLPSEHDAGFYIYVLARNAELSGRWWKLGEDELLGHPYQTAIAKHPGLYEGVDLLLISAVTGQFLPPVLNYHAMILLVLLFNGWVVAWLVRRLTGSYYWAAIAVTLLTLNASTGLRLNGHLHLFKYGWVLLLVWNFVRYLDAPTVGRGFLLGLTAALLLQGSFYLAYLLAIVLGVWWLGCLLGGRLGRGHVAATGVALLTVAVIGGALTYPVWAINREVAFAEQYHQRARYQLWEMGADLWQYFVSPRLQFGLELQAARGLPRMEGWHYAGLTVLFATAAYVILRLRGQLVGPADPRFTDRLFGLVGLCILLSLAGGPSAFLYSLVGSLRAYGRAGLIAVALWSVAAPLVLQGIVSRLRHRVARGVLYAAVLGLALYDGAVTLNSPLGLHFPPRREHPAWVEWAARQPGDLRLAVFPYHESAHVAHTRPWDPLYHRLLHRRHVLNGAEPALLAADLGLLGASAEKLNPDGIRALLGLGYGTLIFHQSYLKANPWINATPWLRQTEQLGDWTVFRPSSSSPALASCSVRALLATHRDLDRSTKVPAHRWITDSFDLKQPVAVADAQRVRLAWAGTDGRLLGRPAPALLHRVYMPGHPAYCVCTPNRPGVYQLVFLDERHQWLASRTVEVTADIETHRFGPGARVPTASGITCLPEAWSDGPVRVTLTNTTPRYVQANTQRVEQLRTLRHVPTVADSQGGSLLLAIRHLYPTEPAPPERFLALPCDLPPHGNLEVEIPSYLLPPLGSGASVEIRPHFQGVPRDSVAAEHADVRVDLSVRR